MSADKFLYFFSKEQTDGDAKLKNLLGGKGANLSEMGRPLAPKATPRLATR